MATVLCLLLLLLLLVGLELGQSGVIIRDELLRQLAGATSKAFVGERGLVAATQISSRVSGCRMVDGELCGDLSVGQKRR